VGKGTRRLTPVLVLMLAAGCRRGPVGLAVVGGRTITVDELSSYVSAQTGRELADVSPDLGGALFERYLEDAVVLAASTDPADRELPAPLRSARARDLLPSLCQPPPQPTDAQLEAYQAKHPEPSAHGDRLRLRQLILPDQAAARSARERIRAGEDFATLSQQLSRAPNAAEGGQIGWIERGQLPPEFEAVVFGLARGEVSDPVASNAGWHVFQVVDRLHAGAGPDPLAQERARTELTAKLAEEARRRCLSTLAARVGVRVDCVGATFACRNPFEGQP
jgi:hypothetical protein